MQLPETLKWNGKKWHPYSLYIILGFVSAMGLGSPEVLDKVNRYSLETMTMVHKHEIATDTGHMHSKKIKKDSAVKNEPFPSRKDLDRIIIRAYEEVGYVHCGAEDTSYNSTG